MRVYVVEDGVDQTLEPIEKVKPRDWLMLLRAQPDRLDVAAAAYHVRHHSAVHGVSPLAHDGDIVENARQELVGDRIVAAMAKGDPLSKHRTEDKTVPYVDDGIILIEAPDVVCDRETGAPVLNGVKILIDPALRVADVSVDEDHIGGKAARDLKDGPVRPGAASESWALGEAERLEEGHDLDASGRRGQRSLKQDRACLAFSHDEDRSVLHARFKITLSLLDEGSYVASFIVEWDADDHAGGADASHCRHDIRMDEPIEFVDLPGTETNDQPRGFRHPKRGDCHAAQSAEHRVRSKRG
jgi:hypothetical protein